MLDGNDIDVKAMVSVDGFSYGDMTSVAVSPDGTLLAAAVQAKGYADNGRVALFRCNDDGTLTYLQAVETGVQPDMVTFTPDGSKILTANEGEPREGYDAGAVDPAGSVTVINAKTYTAQTVGFSAFDHDTLAAQGIVLKKGAAPTVDLEPEYIAATDTAAYITLQEANAIAVLDLTTTTMTGVYSAGFEDYSKIAVDIDKKDEAYSAKTYDSLRGIRMPDGISLYQTGGKTYLLTANEGDSREWGDYLNEDERNFKDGKETSPTGAITNANSGLAGKVVFFDSSDYDGLDDSKDYLFGGRSFTLFEVTDNGLTQVFDSGNDFEAKTAAYLPDYFNCSNDDLAVDDRSGKKGPEPETVTVGQVGDKTYAFVTLERIGGVMVYDITNPAEVSYVNYINSRDFSEETGSDDSPEGLHFIAADASPNGKAMLLAACEVGGTVAAYELSANKNGSSDSGSSDSGSSGSSSGSSAAQTTVTSSDQAITVQQAAVSTAVLEQAAAAAAQQDDVTIIGGSSSAVTVTAKENGVVLDSFHNPLTVTVPVPVNDVHDTSKLTLAQVVTDEDGKTQLIYMGGNYDAKTKTLTAYVDEPGSYVLVEDAAVKKMELTVGSAACRINGSSIGNDVAPMLIDGRTMVPLRLISEAFGAEVVWNGSTRSVTIKTQDKVLNMTVDQVIDGFDAAPVIRNGRTLVPIRYIGQSLDANVIWVPDKQQIVVVR